MVSKEQDRKNEGLKKLFEYDPEYMKELREFERTTRDIILGSLASLGIIVATLLGLAIAAKIIMWLMNL